MSFFRDRGLYAEESTREEEPPRESFPLLIIMLSATDTLVCILHSCAECFKRKLNCIFCKVSTLEILQKGW